MPNKDIYLYGIGKYGKICLKMLQLMEYQPKRQWLAIQLKKKICIIKLTFELQPDKIKVQ